MKAGLLSAVQTSKSAFGDMNKGLVQLSSNSEKASAKAKSIFDTIKSGAQSATSELKKMGEAMIKAVNPKSGGNNLLSIAKGSFLGNFAANLAMKGASMVGGQIMDVKNGGLELGKTKTQLNVLAGETEGGALFADLRKYIKDSVFGPELYSNARTMLGYGIPAKDVMPTTRMLGDISMGDGEKLKSLTLAYAQVRGKGTLQGQEKNQMVEAGYNPLGDIAALTGKTMAQVTKDMEKGLIGFDLVQKAMQRATGAGGKFNGMLDKIGKTPAGLEAQMSGTIEDVKASFGEKLMPLYTKMLVVLTPLVDRLPAILDRTIPYFEKLGSVMSELAPSIGEYGGMLIRAAQPVFDLLTSDSVVGFAKSLISIGTSIGTILTPAISLLSGVVKGIVDLLNPVISWVADKLGIVAKKIENLYEGSSSPKLVAQNSFDMFKGIVPSAKVGGLASAVADPMAAASATTTSAAVAKSNEAIIGGGKKSITFNINHELVRQIITTSGTADTFRAGREAFTEELLRLLGAGAAASI